MLSQFIPLKPLEKFEHRVPHPHLGWVLQPNTRYEHAMPESSVQVTYNSRGWRDIEHTFENPEHKPRVIVLGDSFMEAYSVGLDDAFPRQIATLSRELGIEIEVINLGVGGYGTLQEYLVFDQIGRAYTPHITLLGFYVANDVRNNSAELEALVNPGSMKIESRPFLDPQHPTEWEITRVDFDGAQRRYAEAKARRDSFLQRVMDRSILVQLLNKTANRIPGMISTSLSRSLNTRFLGQHGVNFCIEPPSYTRAWETTARILTRLQQDTEAIGSTLVVFSVPALQDVDSSYRKKIAAKAPNPDTVCFDQAPGYQRLRDILQARTIQYVDLHSVFRAITQSDTHLFHESDRHWNSEGHKIAAEHVLSHLVTEKLLVTEEPPTDIPNEKNDKGKDKEKA